MSTKNLLASIILNGESASLKSGKGKDTHHQCFYSILYQGSSHYTKIIVQERKKPKLLLFVSDECLRTFQKNLQINH